RDALAAKLTGQSGGEADEGEFADAVDGDGREGAAGGLVDDAPAAACAHGGENGLGAEQRAVEIDVEDAVPLVQRDLAHRVVAEFRHEGGVVDENIHAA